MNTQVKRMTCVMSSVISFNPLQRLASKPLPKSTLQRQLGKLQNVPTANHICWSGTQRTLTSIRSVNNYEHQWKAYSTQSSNQKPAGETETDEADRQSGRVSEQLGSETHCSSTDDMTRGGTMNDYVRKASLAREKMKEKMADTVKDMKENIFTIPNLLSTTRLVLSPIIGYLVIHECYTIGACLFTFAGITDLLDGYIARNFKNQQSVLGSIIDPLADKCLVTILALSLTVSGLIPVPLTVLMISRDVGLVGSVVYLRYQSLSPPRTVSRFFDVTHATVQLKPTTISKLNTAVQLSLVGFTLAAPVFQYVDHPFLHALWYTTAATTVLSIFSYVFSKDAFKFLRK
ncbi:cardiolipin synthase (CMP-forming)-like [Asterias rubens]|uniref:cardiolipin synthase (CMP-forming)-like n=1 Tax=Asterias rubens TaxID=7604 RepID=UPI0014559540|nr:cardiolipin synthase (CMP-forming)-like [Asterias rubens]XP_033627409.1 cardiolipin synthase (CMP-forming)-like [Asterias rubens]XP_033627417.1 cardiolipin synthase (CMP-forming)-like [Asterias rubens]